MLENDYNYEKLLFSYWKNKITNFLNLPNSLIKLFCSYNEITNLNILPNGLSELNCSNNQITEIICKQGIVVARRTIAKYRESLNIPAASQRKSL